jgi:hypothetical protein
MSLKIVEKVTAPIVSSRIGLVIEMRMMKGMVRERRKPAADNVRISLPASG